MEVKYQFNLELMSMNLKVFDIEHYQDIEPKNFNS